MDWASQQMQREAMQLHRTGNLQQAEVIYRRILETNPQDLAILNALGNIGFVTGRPELIVETMRRALAVQPKDGGIHHNLGNALRSMGRHDEAIPILEKAISLAPRLAAAHNSLGLALKDLGRMEEAAAAFRQAVAIQPDYYVAHSNAILFLNYQAGVDARALYEEHCAWARLHERPLRGTARAFANERNPERRLRVAYVSPNLRLHSVAYFLLPLLEGRDRERTHVTCYSNSAIMDDITRRIQRAADGWCPVAGATDEQVAERIRKDGIDILVDLAGHTADHRLLVFARRPAPVQITWLGYPGTTGLEGMNYRCSDVFADPADDEGRFSSEKVLRLPRTAWCFTPLSGSPEVAALPALQKGRITFGSFNNLGKISGATLDLWAEILRRVAGSRLLVKNVGMQSRAAAERVRELFAKRGIDAERLELCGLNNTMLDHLRRYNEVGISLDTFPYHGTTTTCESLWMGVPVVTLEGVNHASRVGVSLLANVGMPDLIARSEKEYVEITVKLAGDLGRLAEMRSGLRGRMAASALMDGKGFARDMEAAYRGAWRNWCGKS